ncbi:Fe-S cluster assembly protein IscX [Wolbachia endosymbiont of Ctenocephalides felis wCfeJ]|uniref:Fe-S cluster assembly protein IscX n=1 Tax=Wolbachia endosymbiont of Ctenocephalides felis wCfeJ TaxID=2732594 RepID=UPI001446EC7C|nr:Fe-S cluster assembly protein IscX [Wolbachia endosymbiont of Ctenocephalides felis wCfeJ]WCR58490.1 MAG: Protein IscX [Wolbachia endosymbiont of Ctenocephalides felis wCfeJ]
MKWLDIEDIAEALEEKFPDEDVINIRFIELKKKVLSLEGFDDDEKHCNEKILEAIQTAWIELT